MAATKASANILSSDRRQDEALDCPFSSSYEPMPSTSPPPANAKPSRLKERRGAGSTKRHLEAGECRSKASDLSSDPLEANTEIDLSPSLSSDLPGSEPPIKPPDPYSIPRNPIHLFLVRASTAQLRANQQPPSNFTPRSFGSA